MSEKWINTNLTGQLYMEAVLFWYDGPIHFVAIDDNRTRYNCLLDTDEDNMTVVSPVSTETLIAMLENRIPMEQAFRSTLEGESIMLIDSDKYGELISFYIKSNDIPEKYLPTKGATIDHASQNYIDYLKGKKAAYRDEFLD